MTIARRNQGEEDMGKWDGTKIPLGPTDLESAYLVG